VPAFPQALDGPPSPAPLAGARMHPACHEPEPFRRENATNSMLPTETGAITARPLDAMSSQLALDFATVAERDSAGLRLRATADLVLLELAVERRSVKPEDFGSLGLVALDRLHHARDVPLFNFDHADELRRVLAVEHEA
jgi:hypothetical protein